jgi:adenosine deaminase
MRSKLSWLLLFGLCAPAVAQTVNPAERKAAAAFESAKHAGPPALRAFLEQMPKGADLHMHLSGAVYAETLIADAAADRLCVDPFKRILVKNSGIDSQTQAAICADGLIPAAAVTKDQKLYDALIDSFSMRGFVPSAGVTGHDQFFATFDRFAGISTYREGEWLAEVATRAAAQNEQYLEVMMTPAFSRAAKVAQQYGWQGQAGSFFFETSGKVRPEVSPDFLATLRSYLLASKEFRQDLNEDQVEIDSALSRMDSHENCGQPNAGPGCSVKVRILYQVLRAFPPQQVFAQTLLAFEVASRDSNVVGLNFVQPEDAYMSMYEYHTQMLMLDYLHSVYPKVHISLHAGELAEGLVPPVGLRFHIREAVELGHAERIGHGVDVMDETDAKALLKELADRHVMVEINLTSNDVILGVKAPNHPLPDYRAAKVPVALSTDDEGVSRIDLTHESVRAALEFGLTYQDLKQMARTGMEHTFLPGASFWARPDDFTRPVAACAGERFGADPSPTCGAFLSKSPHAEEQWELERRFRVFEGSLP